jgi:hypothetical protein
MLKGYPSRIPMHGASALSRETGLSRRYLMTILDGVAVPHPLHWPALADAVVG